MKLKRIRTLGFSPTGTTKKVIAELASALPCSTIVDLDLTCPEQLPKSTASIGDLTIVGVPVYAGRVPELALKRLVKHQGNGTPAVAVAVYGNREFEDALLELSDELTKNGFQVVAACAFIGEHSFSNEKQPIAAGRPDKDDIKCVGRFAEKIADALNSFPYKPNHLTVIPGDFPYKEGMKNLPFCPAADVKKCTQCGICISTCPSGAISLEDEIAIKTDLCIFCCACIKNCPEKVFQLTAPPLIEKAAWLHENCKSRKEPQLFL